MVFFVSFCVGKNNQEEPILRGKQFSCRFATSFYAGENPEKGKKGKKHDCPKKSKDTSEPIEHSHGCFHHVTL
jgi:hypothetical protein